MFTIKSFKTKYDGNNSIDVQEVSECDRYEITKQQDYTTVSVIGYNNNNSIVCVCDVEHLNKQNDTEQTNPNQCDYLYIMNSLGKTIDYIEAKR